MEEDWIRSVVTVGGGRGFVIETEREQRFIITAGHCLPHLPPSHPNAYPEERTYAKLIGTLGTAEPTVWAECIFVDPVADLAVLGSPDSQSLADEAEGYEALMESVMPVPVGSLALERKRITLANRRVLGPPRAESDAWLLSLDGQRFACRVRSGGRGLWIEGAAEPIRSGMSGSPVLAPGGAAIGIISTSVSGGREGGPNPELGAHLPAWMMRDVRRA